MNLRKNFLFFVLSFVVGIFVILTSSCKSSDVVHEIKCEALDNFDTQGKLDTLDTGDVTIHEPQKQISFIKEESFEVINSFNGAIYIKTDFPKANVYLNNIYQGKTPLQINEIIPGLYNLKVVFTEKDSTIEKKYNVMIESKMLKRFYIEK